MKKLLLCALLACAGAIVSTSDAKATIYQYICTNTAGELQERLNGTANWTAPSISIKPVSGDSILLNGNSGTSPCLGDVYVATGGLFFGNHNDTSTGCTSDIINGMFEAAGANITINCLEIECTACLQTTASTTNQSPQKENGALVLHDGAVVLAENDFIHDSQTSGIWLARSSSVTLLNSSVFNNGSGGTGIPYTAGIFAKDSSSVQLGLDNGISNDLIYNNGGSGCPGYGVVLEKGSSLESFDSIIGIGEANSCGAIYVDNGSSASLEANVTTPVTNGTAPGPAITVLRGSSIVIEPPLLGGRPSISSGGSSALLLAGASSASLNSASISSPGITAATIEASGSSNLVLAGGNNICAGSFSGSCTASSGGLAIQIDHSSSLQQQQATTLGYATDATETISGGGAVQMQSSLDLGQGTASAITWNLSGTEVVNVQQNSSFRLSGGVTIASGNGVKIQQGSNGFFNVNNGGTNTATIVCANTANNPMAHVSNPADVSSATTYNLNDVLAGDSGAGHPGQTNACLNF